jgi:EAL and modified HD-GYP domain-containing signal transduction protein
MPSFPRGAIRRHPQVEGRRVAGREQCGISFMVTTNAQVGGESADRIHMDFPPVGASESARFVHVGRQPIYDSAGRVVAFELLFRGGPDSEGSDRADASATVQVIINTFGEFGLADIAGGLPCFVNVTREFLIGTLPLPFGPEQAVLEILETVKVDDEVAAGVDHLIEQGYTIALDDFIRGSSHERLLKQASVVKLDLLGTSPEDLAHIVTTCAAYPDITLLGERLETAEHLRQANELGCELFQGYALARPTVHTVRTLSASRLRQVELLAELSGRDVDLHRVVALVGRDPSLAVRLLRVSNSASSGLARRLSSVHEAVVLLGVRRVREWVALMVLGDVAPEADEAQLAVAVARARMCQEVAEQAAVPGDVAFTAGLLIGVAELLGTPVDVLVAGLPVADELADALVRGAGPLGRVIRAVTAYDSADLTELRRLGLPLDGLGQAYLSATAWSQEAVRTVVA